MKASDPMSDPSYAPILFSIEKVIVHADQEARARGLAWTDSQVRSVLNKVRKKAKGDAPVLPRASEREKSLAELFDQLVQVPDGIAVQDEQGNRQPLPVREWIVSLQTVENSIRIRSGGPDSRDYLEFVADFITQDGRAGYLG